MSREEDIQKMREIARGEVEGELDHYLDDMGWSPQETLERLWEWYDEQDTWHPSSKEVKSIKQMMIEFGVVRETDDEELSKHRVGTAGSLRKRTELFKMNGKKYIFSEDDGDINDDRRGDQE